MNNFLCVGVLGFLLSLSSTAHAWGPEGHRIVGKIADEQLTAKTRISVRRIIGSDSLANVANWMDEVRNTPAGAGMDKWHYDNIPVCTGATAPCTDDACATKQIALAEETLRKPNAKRAEKLKALRVLVHLVGDIHQPLHAADNKDSGGNAVIVSNRLCFNYKTKQQEPCKLHQYWDTSLVKAVLIGTNEQYLAEELASTSVTTDGDAQTWAKQSEAQAKSAAYKYSEFACGAGKTTITLTDEYDSAAKPIVKQQLARGGQRLGAILNQIFDPN